MNNLQESNNFESNSYKGFPLCSSPLKNEIKAKESEYLDNQHNMNTIQIKYKVLSFFQKVNELLPSKT